MPTWAWQCARLCSRELNARARLRSIARAYIMITHDHWWERWTWNGAKALWQPRESTARTPISDQQGRSSFSFSKRKPWSLWMKNQVMLALAPPNLKPRSLASVLQQSGCTALLKDVRLVIVVEPGWTNISESAMGRRIQGQALASFVQHVMRSSTILRSCASTTTDYMSVQVSHRTVTRTCREVELSTFYM